ncbi:MAG: tRNA (guanosine(37)-N1)-methyltransferase TrmD [Pseudomonadota bacterium]|nr:tRNA (guanosine(37)-N1)-methyltransferase TrmD [Pseudomonadota bacterium]
MSWRATILTLFPEMFPGFLGHSLAGKALEKGLWALDAIQIRDFAANRHGTVDDTPFGGGAGMVMRPDVIEAAVRSVRDTRPLLYLTPRGKVLDQAMVRDFAAGPGVTILCGRYEGVDERVLEACNIHEISLGDFVLSGGEPAALVLLDACVRLLAGVMGNTETAGEESFETGLLEYPHYTRPAEWTDAAGVVRTVPDVLVSGHHEKVRRWRQEQAEKTTRERRPDLWEAFVRKRSES